MCWVWVRAWLDLLDCLFIIELEANTGALGLLLMYVMGMMGLRQCWGLGCMCSCGLGVRKDNIYLVVCLDV
jgi:hypothetical protein